MSDTHDEKQPYRVLARKYRPATFDDLIGQEALVRTLTNAIEKGRLAQAYVMTGVRGIGKTTTARIVARALNCIGEDGNGGPTPTPCGVCENCKAIAEDRHVDVMEMDAASHTGVGDIREILDGVRYRPTVARYKIYVIDEVHMLSKSAFNALLKTLEEPPEHVKFIFATTEIRKVPVTVLSRCQRFDLKRVEQAVLEDHFAKIAKAENAPVEAEALSLVARAADGSVRDGLSLLDQAIAHGDGSVTVQQVRDMIGLADRVAVFDLLEALFKGEIDKVLSLLSAQYNAGADPIVVVQDLLELTHWLTRVKLSPASVDDPAIPEAERTRGKELAESLAMSVLSRAWQMLLKGLGELQTAPSALMAAEMLLIRLAYAADLPSVEEALKALETEPAQKKTPDLGAGRLTASATPLSSPPPAIEKKLPKVAPPPAEKPPVQQPKGDELDSFEAVVALFREKRQMILASHLETSVRLVSFEPGHLELNIDPAAPRELTRQVAAHLLEWTGNRWAVGTSRAQGQPTLAEQKQAADKKKKQNAAAHPTMQAVLEAFPGARIETVREKETLEIPGEGMEPTEAQ